MRAQRRRATGFTLIEVLIVVVILGILAAMVIMNVQNVRTEAERSAFNAAGHVYVEAAQRFMYKTGNTLPAAATGVMPAGFGPYIVDEYYTQMTPIGGAWDTEAGTFGVTSALGVHFNGLGATRDDAYMQEIDAVVDDGNLATGGFRKLAADRYYFVLVD